MMGGMGRDLAAASLEKVRAEMVVSLQSMHQQEKEDMMLCSGRMEAQMGQKDMKNSLGCSVTRDTIVNVIDPV